MENSNSYITNLAIEELIGGTCLVDIIWHLCYMFKLKRSIFEASKCVDDLHEMERKNITNETLPPENVKYTEFNVSQKAP